MMGQGGSGGLPGTTSSVGLPGATTSGGLPARPLVVGSQILPYSL